MKFSVLMSVYQADDAIFFDQALKSIVANTIQPTEVVLVCDGKLTAELEQVIDDYQHKLPMYLLRLESNVGLGLALQAGLQYCTYEWVARFDADDICCEDRFAKHIDFLQKNPNIDIFGGQIIEFNQSPNETAAVKKRVPLEYRIIESYAKSRNPMNHMTVMFRKSAVIDAGNYQHAPLYEDYDLWVRMLIRGFKFANIDQVLVYARVGDKMYQRRGGLSYATQETIMQYSFYKLGFLSRLQLIKNLMLRIPIRVIPSNIRGMIYSKVLR